MPNLDLRTPVLLDAPHPLSILDSPSGMLRLLAPGEIGRERATLRFVILR